MVFHFRPPPALLSAFVAGLWYCENEPGPLRLERVLPSGAGQIIINLTEDQTRGYHPATGALAEVGPGAVLCGLATRAQVIDSHEQEQVVGVSFLPWGTRGFFAAPAAELADRDVPLEALWGARTSARLRERLLEAPTPEARLDTLEETLLSHLRLPRPHPAVAWSLATLAAEPNTARVNGLSQAVGLSERRFRERFELEVGTTPKRYSRILRFQQALAQVHRRGGVDWSQVALDCGFYDQSHLVGEFRAFSGLTPTAYLSQQTEFQNHVRFFQDTAP